MVDFPDRYPPEEQAQMQRTIGAGIARQAEPPRDPWQHRDKHLLCSTCMWSLFKKDRDGVLTSVGRCRRHAPTMNGYPVIRLTDWCGDHKLDENKIA